MCNLVLKINVRVLNIQIKKIKKEYWISDLVPKSRCGGDVTVSACSENIRNEHYRARGSFSKILETQIFKNELIEI